MQITVTAAASLAGVSRRTIRRWFGDGEMIDLEALQPHLPLLLSFEDMARVAEADRGDPEAEADVAMMLHEAGRHLESVWWLQRAAAGGHADAMQWLARAYTKGEGVAKDRYEGLMWLARAAIAGHKIARDQIDVIVAQAGRR